ncbi:MAG: hypothetical protein ACE5HS_05105 [bacterium]
MKKQLSHIGIGMILTLLMLGLSHKGSYGKVPVNINRLSQILQKGISSNLADLNSHNSPHINSLFVQNDGSGAVAMIVLVAYNGAFTKAFQQAGLSRQIPLIFSISSLPFQTANLNPALLRFEQGGKSWQPTDSEKPTIFTLFKNGKFGGAIHDGDIHQGLVLLPEWFDIEQPITIRYLNNKREFHF